MDGGLVKRLTTGREAPSDARHLLEGHPGSAGALILTLALLLVAGGAWAGWAKVEEVVQAPGQVEPAGRVKLVNHPKGGKVTDLLVQDGDTVEAGEVVLKLDGRQNLFDRDETLGLWQVRAAEAARLVAEASGKDIVFPDGLAEARPDLVAQEKKLFAARADAVAERRETLRRSVESRKSEVGRAGAEASRLKGSRTLLGQQHEAVKELTERGLYPKLKLVELEGQIVDAEGEAKKAEAGLAATRAALAEAESRLASFAKDTQSEILSRLSAVTAERDRLGKLLEGEDTKIAELDVRAPASGVVQDLAVTAVGQSVGANEPLMTIVPVAAGLVVKARVPDSDIARVKEGMPVRVKVHAYDFARFGALEGTVQQINADASRRGSDDARAYGITVLTDRASMDGQGAFAIAPGMAVDVELQVGSRSILSFLADGLFRWREGALKQL
ncbi:MAG: HlyD family type I secretion periplasmic adaptor subunit [Geminicoccaceae bacterium]|nr:HlyD family type I secretion periplasmic adaptor subunit [Geminicoccaceae bacterium]